MKPQTLKTIQTEIGKFATLYEKLVEYWNGRLKHGNDATYPVTVLVGVILGNMALDSSHCYNYDYNEAVEKLYESLKLLLLIDIYEDRSYMTHYAYNTISMIISGNTMSEDYEPETDIREWENESFDKLLSKEEEEEEKNDHFILNYDWLKGNI